MLEFDLILTNKICYCLIGIDFNDFFVCDKANYNLRGPVDILWF